MKKFLLPKMSLKRPAIGVTTAAAKDQEVAIHAICVDGPMAALMFKRMAAGRTKEKRQASYVKARACRELDELQPCIDQTVTNYTYHTSQHCPNIHATTLIVLDLWVKACIASYRCD